MNLNKLKDLFLKACYAALENINPDGCMPSGHNGSYHDIETSVRNTAHWIISFSKAYKITNDICFYEAIVLCVNYLKNEKLRPSKKTYNCRNKEGKDKCNGLIGQAWIIEGLISGYEIVKDKEILLIVEELFILHPFSKEKKMWHRVQPNGNVLSLDLTFNHQLWFAMAGFKILNIQYNKTIEKRCLSFFNAISSNLKLSKNGRIGQAVKQGFKQDFIKNNLKRILRKNEIEYMKLKEVGYHAFNTYAFSEVYSLYPEIQFFKTDLYSKIIKYLSSNEYITNIYKSKYGFKYNPPGFEVLRTYLTHKELLAGSEHFVKSLLNFHIKNNYNHEDSGFTKNVHDENTSAARIYELSTSFKL
jgi:hypothetical protein